MHKRVEGGRFRYGPHTQVMRQVSQGGPKYREPPKRESYAVKLARYEAAQAGRCPGTTKKGEPCKGKLGQCPWHEPDA